MSTTATIPDSWLAEPPQLAHVSTVDGWQSYVSHRDDYQPPQLLTRAEYDHLEPALRSVYDMARMTAVANPPNYQTPMGQALTAQLLPTLIANTANFAPGVRPGCFVSADAGLGKSTLIRDLAAKFDDSQRFEAKFRPSVAGNRDRWIPVAWVNVPPKVSLAGLCRDILDFYGEVPKGRPTESELTARVRAVIADCGTRLLVLDDITRLKMHREADQNAADFIRSLMETAATVIGVGVDVEGSGLLFEGQAARRNRHLLTQTRRRFTVHTLRPFSNDTEEMTAGWLAHLRAIEQDLPLLDKQPGMLTGGAMPAYLLQRTGGVIGTLARLITEASIRVLGQRRSSSSAGELLTRDVLASVILDHAAEHQSPDLLLPPGAAGTTTPKRARNTAFNGRGRGVDPTS